MHLLKPKEDLIKIIERADRLYQFQVPIIGLTGGIGTGKSTVAKLLKKAHLPLIDADALIKSIYQMPEIIENIKTLAPNAIAGNQIDFRVLRSLFFNDKTLKAKIEKMLYAQMPEAFKLAYKELGSPDFVIYDIPLLFEKKLENKAAIRELPYGWARLGYRAIAS